MPTPKYGDRVRVRCGATGRYVNDGLALVVSAMDNGLFLDQVVEDGGEPHPRLPVPSDDAMKGAFVALTHPGHRHTAAPSNPRGTN